MNRGDKISKESVLYRRGYNSPEKKYLNPDGSATSRVFKLRIKDNGGLSVDLASFTTKEKAIINSSNFNLFELKNKIVESADLITVYDANFTNDNNSHCLIIGMDIEDDTKPAYLAKHSKKIYP